ncbi:aminoglycoside phosphotransferase family protein [Hyphomonas sp. NPDC076900]|uniref:aminoglycoside phosphotransferase family protein n=1 Tax=unclassified Hyphomonas TaxID=2630699 RepID=UPI003D025AD6
MPDASSLQPIDPEIAADLIARQFPELAGLEISAQPSLGTDNTIIRIGSDLCARFPRVSWATGTARREADALPRFAGAPITVPTVYGKGKPSEAFPYPWSVLTWLPGIPLTASALASPAEAGRLASFCAFLRSVPPENAFRFGADNNWRGAPLAARSASFEAALARLPTVYSGWANRLWSQALRAEAPFSPAWLHGDIHPGNILVENGRMTGVIDWGLCGVGDAACDLLSAWAMFDAPARDVFRAALGASEAEWLRGAGWALSMAVIFLPYAYENGLPCDMSEKMIERLMEDFA